MKRMNSEERRWKTLKLRRSAEKLSKLERSTQMPKKLSMLQELQEELAWSVSYKAKRSGNACTETASQSYKPRSQRKLDRVWCTRAANGFKQSKTQFGLRGFPCLVGWVLFVLSSVLNVTLVAQQPKCVSGTDRIYYKFKHWMLVCSFTLLHIHVIKTWVFIHIEQKILKAKTYVEQKSKQKKNPYRVFSSVKRGRSNFTEQKYNDYCLS